MGTAKVEWVIKDTSEAKDGPKRPLPYLDQDDGWVATLKEASRHTRRSQAMIDLWLFRDRHSDGPDAQTGRYRFVLCKVTKKEPTLPRDVFVRQRWDGSLMAHASSMDHPSDSAGIYRYERKDRIR